MEIDEEKFRKMFPRLAREIEGEKQRVAITSVRSDIKTGEKASSKKFDGYMPDAIDFIRRCDTDQQAEEIISYLEERKEIDKKYARMLKKQLKEKGVRSFGTKKEDDYYLKQDEL